MAWGAYSLRGYTVENLQDILDEGKKQLEAANASGNTVSAKRLKATIDDILKEQARR